MNEIAPIRLPIGIHAGIPDRIYHADPAPEISASASILKKLSRQSPEHAWQAHPRLNPAWEPSSSSEAKDKGTILHSMILGTAAPYKAVNVDSWRGKNADIRDEIRTAGMIPILAHKLDDIHVMADAFRDRIKTSFPTLHAALADPETLTEATIICKIDGVTCRVRVDVLPPPSYGFMGDLKFTGLDAPPDEYERTVKREYRFQADLYPRAVQATRGDLPEFRFFSFEEEKPHGAAVYTFVGSAMERNRTRVNVALAQWAACMRANQWPGYPTMMHAIEDEPYEDQHDVRRVMRHDFARQVSTGLIADLHRIAADLGGPLR